MQSLGYSGVREVAETGPVAVQRRIEHIVAEVARSILEGHGFAYAVPNRGASNQMYIAELDRIVLRDKLSVRPFVGTSTVRKTAIMTRVMQLVHEVLSKNIHTTKRDLFYTDVKLFKSQEESNAVLDDVACMAGCTRTSLHVVASEKGVVVGRLQFRGAPCAGGCIAPPLHTPPTSLAQRTGTSSTAAAWVLGARPSPHSSTKSQSSHQTRSSCCWWRRTPPSCAWQKTGSTTSTPASSLRPRVSQTSPHACSCARSR